MKKPHIIPEYDNDLNELRRLLDGMGDAAQLMLSGSLRALEARDAEEARLLVAMDSTLDAMEMAVDDRCLKLLARWQPVGSDLRFIATALKAVTDLERIGDHAVNICERTLKLQALPPLDRPVELINLGRFVSGMVGQALEALRSEDVGLAGQVLQRAPRAEMLVREVLRGCLEALRREPEHLEQASSAQEIAAFLQRIAAHATNIAELAFFLVRGEDVRHEENWPTQVKVVR